MTLCIILSPEQTDFVLKRNVGPDAMAVIKYRWFITTESGRIVYLS
jgi:hypothetical protein